MTERTYRRLEDGFVLERRTGVVVKGKGEMTTYVLLGERPEPSEVPYACPPGLRLVRWSIGLQTADAAEPLSKVSLKA